MTAGETAPYLISINIYMAKQLLVICFLFSITACSTHEYKCYSERVPKVTDGKEYNEIIYYCF